MTPEYASPEHVRGAHVTTAADIYSLGVVLYELLTGVRPYRLKDSSPEELSRAICDSEPSKPSDAASDEQRKDTFAYRASKFIGRKREAVAAAIAHLTEALQLSSGANLQGNERGLVIFNKPDLGGALLYSGEVEKGERLLREAAAEYRQLFSEPRWELGATLMLLSVAALSTNLLDEAEQVATEARDQARQNLGEESPLTKNATDNLAAAYEKQGENAQARGLK